MGFGAKGLGPGLDNSVLLINNDNNCNLFTRTSRGERTRSQGNKRSFKVLTTIVWNFLKNLNQIVESTESGLIIVKILFMGMGSQNVYTAEIKYDSCHHAVK